MDRSAGKQRAGYMLPLQISTEKSLTINKGSRRHCTDTWFLVGTLGITLVTVPSNCSILISSNITVPGGSRRTSVATSLPWKETRRKSSTHTLSKAGQIIQMVRLRDHDISAKTYISILNGKLHIVSGLQCLQVTLKLTVVKENLLHHICPLNKSKCILRWQKNTFNETTHHKNRLHKCTSLKHLKF